MPTTFANERELYYEEAGTDGEPLVFLSGLGGDHRAFSVAQRYFSRRFRTLAVDARDAGRSDRADAPYSTADLADDVAGVLDAVGIDSAHVVGQSLGGLVAQELAIRHPGRIKSLVLVSTHAGSNEWRKAVIESWITLRGVVDAGRFTRATLPWLVAPSFYARTEQIDGLIRFAERNPWPQAPAAFTRQARAAIAHDARERLGGVAAACLVVVGALDLVNPPHVAEDLANRLPNARTLVLPNVGHLPHIENSIAFREALEQFLPSV